MRRRRLFLAALSIAALATGGAVAGVSLTTGGGGDAPTMPVEGVETQHASDARPPSAYRIVISELARDDLLKLVVAGLATDRSAPEPLRLWVGGDSTAVYMGAALASTALATGGTVTGQKYTISSGLSRPDFFDWPDFLAGEMAQADPNVVVLMLGANDAQGVVTPDGHAVSTTPLSPEWRAAYSERVGQAMETMVAQGRLVVWVGQPVMGPPDYNERMQVLSGIFREQADAHPGVLFVDSYGLFADADGQFQASIVDDGAPVTMRTSDGIHFTTAGGAYLAAAVMREIRAHKDLLGG